MSKIYQKKTLDRKTRQKHYFGGFTLVELLVVVLIIGILAAVALPKYSAAVAKSRAVEALISLKALAQAQSVYHMANGHYSDDLTLLDIQPPGEVSSSGSIFSSNYTFYCSAEGICQARNLHQNTTDMPAFEVQMARDVVHCICRGKACNICKSMGGIEAGHFNGDDAVYYKI